MAQYRAETGQLIVGARLTRRLTQDEHDATHFSVYLDGEELACTPVPVDYPEPYWLTACLPPQPSGSIRIVMRSDTIAVLPGESVDLSLRREDAVLLAGYDPSRRRIEALLAPQVERMFGGDGGVP